MKLSLYFVFMCTLISSAFSQNCSDLQFQCDNGRCLSYIYVCDGKNDCGDNSDELQTPNDCPPCLATQFRCGTGRCIPRWWICDMNNDCGDGSDEQQDCPPCPDTWFQCEIGGCIYSYWTCDGYNDCKDWSDEKEETCPCAENEFRCSPEEPGAMPPGICVKEEYVCDPDGIWDCPNGADERNCTAAAASTII